MDTPDSKDVFREEEVRNNLAETIVEIIRNNLCLRFQPFKGRRKKLEAQNDISRACEDTYKRFKKKGKKFNSWLETLIAFLHWDFTNDCTLFDQWEKWHGKQQGNNRKKRTA